MAGTQQDTKDKESPVSASVGNTDRSKDTGDLFFLRFSYRVLCRTNPTTTERSSGNQGVRSARKTIRWIVFSGERAGRPRDWGRSLPTSNVQNVSILPCLPVLSRIWGKHYRPKSSATKRFSREYYQLTGGTVTLLIKLLLIISEQMKVKEQAKHDC